MNEFHTRSQFHLFLTEQGTQLLYQNCPKLACYPEMNTSFKSQTMITAVLKIKNEMRDEHHKWDTKELHKNLSCVYKNGL